MDRAIFLERAEASFAKAISFGQEFAQQELPSHFVLLVFPNSSCDFDLRDGEVVFPDESIPPDTHLGPMNLAEFVDRFWRDGMVPEWIDVNAAGVSDQTTLLEVRVCGRFTLDESLLYHQNAGRPPFSVKGPAVPPDWDKSKQKKFDINWFRKRRPVSPVAPRS
jgi:hypothetical protein